MPLRALSPLIARPDLPSPPPGENRSQATGPRAVVVLAGLALVATLYFASEILIPLVLAVLLAFVLGPPVRRLRRMLGRTLAVAVVVLVATGIILGLGVFVASQVASLADQLPTYQRNVATKISALRKDGDTGLIARGSRYLDTIKTQFDDATKPAEGLVRDDKRPIPVEIREPESTPLRTLRDVASPLLHPLASTALVLLFVVFLLLQRDDLRDRVIRLAGPRDLHRTTTALNDAAIRVSRYLVMQLVINTAFGIQIGIGLSVIGTPNPLLWGIGATVLRFIPMLGPVLAAFFPILLGVAIDPGWSVAVWTIALFVCVELVTGNVLEPLLYGKSTGLSPLAYLVAITFWTWLWGPIGLLLSTPLTVCLVVLGRHVPQFEPIAVLLGNEEPLAPEETFYQRLLAGDPIEATTQAESFLASRPAEAFFQEVAIPALAMAQRDADRKALSSGQLQLVTEHMLSVIDLLNEDDDDDKSKSDEPARELVGELRASVLLLPGRGMMDLPIAMMLARLLRDRQIGSRIASNGVATPDDLRGVLLCCQCFAHAPSDAYLRIAHRRVRRTLPPNVPAVLFLPAGGGVSVDAAGAEAVTTSLHDTVERLAGAVGAIEPRAA